MGKTDTIKDRRVDVYVDTIEQKEKWADRADEADESLSKFVQQCVEYAIKQGGPDFAELGEESKKIQELEQVIQDLQKDAKQKEIVIEKLESEVKQHRVEPFLEEEFDGRRRYEEELIDILQEGNGVTGDELVRRLSVDPTETDLVKGIDSQLRRLEEYGLIKSTSNGWMWEG